MSRSWTKSALPSSAASRCFWLPLAGGVAAGWTVARLLRGEGRSWVGDLAGGRSRPPSVDAGSAGQSGRERGSEAEEGRWTHWVALLEEAVGDAVEGLAGVRERLFGRRSPDLAALEAVIERVPRAHGCRLRPLGDGIVELVGVCDDDEVAERVAAMVGAVPGVRVVVNRVWTPSSSVRIDPPGASG